MQAQQPKPQRPGSFFLAAIRNVVSEADLRKSAYKNRTLPRLPLSCTSNPVSTLPQRRAEITKPTMIGLVWLKNKSDHFVAVLKTVVLIKTLSNTPITAKEQINKNAPWPQAACGFCYGFNTHLVASVLWIINWLVPHIHSGCKKLTATKPPTVTVSTPSRNQGWWWSLDALKPAPHPHQSSSATKPKIAMLP